MKLKKERNNLFWDLNEPKSVIKGHVGPTSKEKEKLKYIKDKNVKKQESRTAC